MTTLELTHRAVEALAAAEAGDFAAARIAAEDVLARSPRHLQALRTLAWAQLKLDDPAAADTFRTCIQIDPEDAVAEVGLAVWLDQAGRREQATDHYLRAWELDPFNQELRLVVAQRIGELPDSPLAEGISLSVRGWDDQAATLLRQAAAIDPPDAAALLALAEVLWRLGGRQQAYNIGELVLQSNPDCVKALVLLLAREAESGRTLHTRELLGRALAVDPGLQLYAHFSRYFGVEPVLARYGVRA